MDRAQEIAGRFLGPHSWANHDGLAKAIRDEVQRERERCLEVAKRWQRLALDGEADFQPALYFAIEAIQSGAEPPEWER